MFGWFVKKFDKMISDDVHHDEDVFDAPQQRRLDEANFQMQDGTECLLSKVIESVKHEFDQWRSGDCWWEKKTDTETIKIYMNMFYYLDGIRSGTLFIDDVNFSINHDACERFLEVWKEEFGKRDRLKKDVVLKK
jgi:hypothetical protein